MFPVEDLEVEAPPLVRSQTGGLPALIPLLGVAAMLGAGVLLWTSGWSATRNPTALVFPVMAVLSAIGVFVQGATRRGAAELDDQRQRYFDHLDQLSDRLVKAAALQLHWLAVVHPPPSGLWTLVGGGHMWEREPPDTDFGHVRLGLAEQRLCRRIVIPPLPPADHLDPVAATALRRFVHTHSTIRDAPLAVALRGIGAISVAGDHESARGLVRAMVCQLAVFHGPDHLRIEAREPDGVGSGWSWLKWLPHSQSPNSGRHVVVIIDGDSRAVLPDVPDGASGVTVIVVGQHCDQSALAGAVHLRVEDGQLALRTHSGDEVFARADTMSLPEAKACARQLARCRRAEFVADGLQLWRSELGLGGPGLVHPEDLWQSRSQADRLRVPIGVTSEGSLLDLDIKEAAERGIGPHGLCVGATGSGKSELLRTVVLGMVARHSPDDVNLVLVDFKGGATFLGLDGLRHVAAVITNLSDEGYLVARMKDALAGEVDRRQQLLRRAGNATKLADYQTLRRSDPDLPVLPALFIVVDEFAELLQHHPDFAELFAAIGRVGRSLGMHLLLASQRLDEGRLRGLESHLSYRICLKTMTTAESRSVLGVADAAELPATPGAAILRSSDGRLVRFQTVCVGVPQPVSPEHVNLVGMPGDSWAVQPFTGPSADRAVAAPDTVQRQTVMEAVVDLFRGRGSRAHRVWLPPLESPPQLSRLLSHLIPDLTAPIGVVDLPFAQRRDPFVVDLGGAGGNVAVVGAPQTGKSAAVQTLVAALSGSHSSRRIQFYCLDFGGGGLSGLRSLPHVGSVAGRTERDLVRRTVGHVEAILRSREAQFAECGIRSVAEFRLRLPEDSDDPYGDVFLVIDGWPAFRDEFGELEATVTAIAGQGLSVGVHVLIAAGRWADIRPGLKDQLGTKIELRLADTIDSEIDRRQATLVPRRPGHGIAGKGDHFVLALPDLTQVGANRDLDCRQAPPVRLLPATVDLDAVRRAGTDPRLVYIGVGERELVPIALDFQRHCGLLILGDSECGKTAVLRAICRQITGSRTGSDARLYLVDYRRTLLGVADTEHLGGYGFSALALADLLPGLLGILESRLPMGNIAAEQLRTRSWWSGPEIFLVVDDYDLVSAGSGDPLGSLLRYLPHARDIGLHVVIARRSAGSARAMFEPVLAQLRDGDCMTLLMSGSADEGAVVKNLRPAPQPTGRGLLVTRGDSQLVQVGWCPA